MSDTVANFKKLRRKDVYLKVADAANQVPQTSRKTLSAALHLFADDIKDLDSYVKSLIGFSCVLNFMMLLFSIFDGHYYFILCNVMVTGLVLYLNVWRENVLQVIPAAIVLAESPDNVPPYSLTTRVFWF